MQNGVGFWKIVRSVISQASWRPHIFQQIKYGPRREKTCLRWFENNKGADQPAHLCSLISTFVIRLWESVISKPAIGKISLF